MQGAAQRGVVAEFGIPDDRRQLKPACADLSQQRQGESPFFLKAHGGAESGRAVGPPVSATPRADTTPRPASRPAPRSTARRSPPPGNWRPCPSCRSTAARRRPNADPASGSSSRRESAHRVRSGITVRSCRHIRSALHGRVGDEVLKRLIRAGIGDALEHRAHRLAATVAQQPEQIAAKGARVARCALKQTSNGSSHALNRSSHTGALRGSRDSTESAAYRSQRTSTRPLFPISFRSRRESADLTKSHPIDPRRFIAGSPRSDAPRTIGQQTVR